MRTSLSDSRVGTVAAPLASDAFGAEVFFPAEVQRSMSSMAAETTATSALVL